MRKIGFIGLGIMGERMIKLDIGAPVPAAA